MIYKAYGLAQRGRYTNEHKPGAPTKQRLEMQKEEGICNAITTVQKDFMVIVLTDSDIAGEKNDK